MRNTCGYYAHKFLNSFFVYFYSYRNWVIKWHLAQRKRKGRFRSHHVKWVQLPFNEDHMGGTQTRLQSLSTIFELTGKEEIFCPIHLSIQQKFWREDTPYPWFFVPVCFIARVPPRRSIHLIERLGIP